MEKADHQLTSSWGNSAASQAWRAQQKALIEAGRFDDAILMDIADIQRLFESKYDDAILQLIDSL